MTRGEVIQARGQPAWKPRLTVSPALGVKGSFYFRPRWRSNRDWLYALALSN